MDRGGRRAFPVNQCAALRGLLAGRSAREAGRSLKFVLDAAAGAILRPPLAAPGRAGYSRPLVTMSEDTSAGNGHAAGHGIAVRSPCDENLRVTVNGQGHRRLGSATATVMSVAGLLFCWSRLSHSVETFKSVYQRLSQLGVHRTNSNA